MTGDYVMLKIAICDDDTVFVQLLNKKVEDYFADKDINYKSYCYNDSRILEKEIKTILFDLLLLDIEMPAYSGLELAEILRKFSNYASIIFISNEDRYVFSSIKFSPLGYIRKRFLDQEFTENMDLFFKLYSDQNHYIEFDANKGKQHFDIRFIRYVEVYDHKLLINYKEYDYSARGRLKDIYEMLRCHGFIRIHRSILINYRFFDSMKGNNVRLTDGKQFFYSKYRKKEIENLLLTFSRRLNL